MKGNDTIRAVRCGCRVPVVRAVAVIVATALGLTGCSDGEPTSAEPTEPTAASSSTTATTAPVDVSVVPESIDESYLNAVLAALDEIDGQATRIIYENKSFTPRAADLLNTIYSDEQLEIEANAWFAGLADDLALQNIRPSPGPRRTDVERVIAASPACAWLAVRRDYSARNFDPGPDRTEYVALEPIDRSNDPTSRNRTPWMITADGLREDGAEPSNPCAGA